MSKQFLFYKKLEIIVLKLNVEYELNFSEKMNNLLHIKLDKKTIEIQIKKINIEI